MEEFIKQFANQFDDTDLSVFSAETSFHDLEEWGSLTGFAILNMIAKQYGVKISPAELKECETVQDVYNIVQAKK